MLKNTHLKISVVIPAYNEEANILACLEAVLRQTYKPSEIIVVDNGSTDRTAEIVAGVPGVKLIQENHRGVLFARTRGFNMARGDIIARTDADSLPDELWLENINNFFVYDQGDAVSGKLDFYDVKGMEFFKKCDTSVRRLLSKRRRQPHFLAGANMAIKRSVWEKVQSHTCPRDDIHEDLDLAIHLEEKGFRVGFDPEISVSTSARRMNTSAKEFYAYMKKFELTYQEHGINRFSIKIPKYLYMPVQPLAKIGLRAYQSDRTSLWLRRIAAAVSAR